MQTPFLVLDVPIAKFVWSLCFCVNALILAQVSLHRFLLFVEAILCSCSHSQAHSYLHIMCPGVYLPRCPGGLNSKSCTPPFLDPGPWQPGFQSFRTPPQGACPPASTFAPCVFVRTLQGNSVYRCILSQAVTF